MNELKVLGVLWLRWPKFFNFLALVTIVGIVAEAIIISNGGQQSFIPGSSIAADYPFQGGCNPVVTQGYGPVDNPREPIINGVHFHTGIDLACPEGTLVYSTTGGVAHVTLGYGGGYGNNVVVEFLTQLGLDTSQHHYFVRYAHLDSVLVGSGSIVSPGQAIGREGSTGNSSGPHLHFEIDRDAANGGNSINPIPYLKGLT